VESHVSNTAFVAVFLTSLFTNSGNLGLNENEVSEIYRNILSKAMKVFKIGALPPESLRLTESSNPESVMLVKLVKQCDSMSIEKTDIFEALLNCIRESSTQDLWHNVLLPFISSICEYLGKGASSSPISAEKTYIPMLIDACLPKYVASLGGPPQRPVNWKRKLQIACSCGDCQLLRNFVESPHEKDRYFKMMQKRRTHLARQLDGTFLTTTISQGTPHALKVEKTCKQYEADLRVWQNEVTKIRSELNSLANYKYLVSIIGDDQYKRLLKHECFRIPGSMTRPESSDTHLRAVHSGGHSIPSESRKNSSDSVGIPKKRSFVDLSKD
jgi:hypothetical protein